MSRPDASDRAELNLPDESTVEFLLRFARVAHRAGYPTADLEERLGSLADALGLEAPQISATPTLVELSFGSLPRQRSYTLRVRPTTVDLDAIARLEDLARDVGDGRVTVGDALDRLATIDARPLERRWYIELAAYAVAGGAVTPVLGGGWREVAAGGVVGLLVGVVAQLARRTARAESMVAPLAAVVASFSAAAIARLGLKASADTVTLAALVTFLPGMSLTIGVRETIGTVGGLLAAPLRRPPLVFIVPGVLMLVPGSAGFNSLLQLLTGQTVSGIDAGFNAFVTAMAIAYGLMVSTVILPPRLSR